MSYVDGETLGERLRANGPLPPAEATRVLREVAWALAYAHQRGIVHRDVKPDNILLEASTGRALVTDFGIAHGGREPDTSDAGKIMGTAQFMSPEQMAGQPIDGRTDIYSLGVVGYLALSGRLPFEAANVPALALQQMTEAPPGVALAAPGLPPALGSAIDRCLERNPDDRFEDGEALAAALTPTVDSRPALPSSLRAWLNNRNPLLVPYLGWSAGFTLLATGNYVEWLRTARPNGGWDVVILATAASLPLYPIVGFHIYQAYRQFKAGYTLSDLRFALDVARQERAETEAAGRDKREPASHRLLRAATVAAATWLAVTFGLLQAGVVHERNLGILYVLAPFGSTLLFGAISNALAVQFIPSAIRTQWESGLRDRLWNTRLGNWLARKLGAPEKSRAVGGGVFRATEAALGVAAAELFAALPSAYREQVGDLPNVIAALEARAAAARAEIDIVDAMAQSDADSEVLSARRRMSASQLAESVAALESIRIDLLRLHAGSNDLAPLTTLMDAARAIGDDLNRLAEAQKEAEIAVIERPA
jgi:serine/threonine-protein kinase